MNFLKHIRSWIGRLEYLASISKKYHRLVMLLSGISAILISLALVIFFIVVIFPAAQEAGTIFKLSGLAVSNENAVDSVTLQKINQAEDRKLAQLQKKLDGFTPRTNYLVVNTTENNFHLFSGKKLLRTGICSTGSYTLLENDKDQKWIFKTPKGIFKIRNKRTEPVWKKPDWAFIEEGLPVPSPNHPSRFEYGTLGDYALSLGDGYMIHGTIYQRFLGLPVTHGCIRVGDDDLYAIYRALPMGSKVYIY